MAHRLDPFDHALRKAAGAALLLHAPADRLKARGADVPGDSAVRDDLDVPIREQEVNNDPYQDLTLVP